MKHLFQKIIAIVLITQLVVPSGYSAFLLERTWNTRARGMGGAFTAVANDTGALTYNNAGLGFIDWFEMNCMYSQLYTGLDGVDMGLNFVGLVYPFARGSLGLNWARFSTTDLYKEDTIQIGYGAMLSDVMSIGVGVDYLSQGYVLGKNLYDKTDPVFAGDNDKYAFGVNAGLLLRGDHVSLGLSGRNLNRPDIGRKTTDIVPPEYRGGIALHSKTFTLPIDVAYRDQEYGTDQDKTSVAGGLEVWITRALGIRGGMRTFLARDFEQGKEVTAGFTFMNNNVFRKCDIGIEYAAAFPINGIQDTNGSHQVALVIRYGKLADYAAQLKTPVVDTAAYERSRKKEGLLAGAIDPRITVAKGLTAAGKEVAEISIDGTGIIKVYATVDGLTPLERLTNVAVLLTNLLRTSELNPDDFSVASHNGRLCVMIKGQEIIPVDYDATATGIDKNTLATKWEENLKKALVKEEVLRKEKNKTMGSRIEVRQAFSTVGEVGVVAVDGKDIIRLYVAVDDKTPYQRATQLGEQIGKYLDGKVRPKTVFAEKRYGNTYVFIDNERFVATDFDAQFIGMTPDDLAAKWVEQLQWVFGARGVPQQPEAIQEETEQKQPAQIKQKQ